MTILSIKKKISQYISAVLHFMFDVNICPSKYLELHGLHWNTYQRIPFLIRYTGAFIHTYVG